ncbi:MAG: hypothetical protein ACYTF7_11340 [Planctomycetota bacterium]|jgi:hypothetical protein
MTDLPPPELVPAAIVQLDAATDRDQIIAGAELAAVLAGWGMEYDGADLAVVLAWFGDGWGRHDIFENGWYVVSEAEWTESPFPGHRRLVANARIETRDRHGWDVPGGRFVYDRAIDQREPP